MFRHAKTKLILVVVVAGLASGLLAMSVLAASGGASRGIRGDGSETSHATEERGVTETPEATHLPEATETAGPTETPRATETRATHTPEATETFPNGDVNDDGGVNSVDAALTLQYDDGLVASLPNLRGADINHDGAVNSIDAEIMLQMVAGLIA